MPRHAQEPGRLLLLERRHALRRHGAQGQEDRQDPWLSPRKQADAEKPAGEWNTFTTVCDGNTVTILVNGKEVNKATGTNLSEGFIGLQVEGGAFEVKRCTLEPL